jgi:hypothetical protein
MIINAKNIFYTPDGFISTQYKEYDEATTDTIIEYDEDDKKQIVQGVFKNTNDILLLGGEEDIQGFKDYMNNKSNLRRELTPEAREVIKIARANFSEEEASLIENRLLTGEDSFGDISNFTCS